MKFARTALIARVQAEIARLEQAAAERNAKAAQSHEKNLKQYMDRTGPAWSEFATTIRRRQRNGQPIVSKDIPQALRNGYTGGHVATFDSSMPDEYTANTAHLKTLLDLLEAATDGEVTTTSLERMGFRMAQLFRA